MLGRDSKCMILLSVVLLCGNGAAASGATFDATSTSVRPAFVDLDEGQGCQVFADDMESGAPGWSHGIHNGVSAKTQIADPPGPSTWHVASTTCRGSGLGSSMFVSNGNDGPECSPGSSRDSSRLLSPPIPLPESGNLLLEFDALSFDEAGSCLDSGSFDKHDVGLTTDGGATYVALNDCTPLTDGEGTPAHHVFDISNWAGQTVQVIFVYDTVDDRTGHAFAVDNVSVSADVCTEVLFFSAGKAAVAHGWETVELPHNYSNPVVIAGPASRKGSHPGVIRVRNTGGSQFEARYQEWDYLDGFHFAQEDFSYLVFPAGRHVMPDGSIWEAGTFDLSGTGAELPVDFGQAFPGTPSLFLTTQTSNDSEAVTVRASGVTPSGFGAALFEQESLMDGHPTETIGYLAVFKGSGWGEVTVNGSVVPYLLQSADVDQRFAPVLSFNLKIEEEKSADTENVHMREPVDVLALGTHVFAQDTGMVEADTMTLRRLDADSSIDMEWGVVRNVNEWFKRVPLSRSYTSPVVIVKPSSNRGADGGVLRVFDIQPDSFFVRFEEWNYLNGTHTAEWIFYMVVESGVQTIGTPGGGLTVEAGTLDSNWTSRFGGWNTVDLTGDFVAPPAVFSAVQTAAGSDAVTTRNRYATAGSFQLTMQEEDGGDLRHHKSETIGWVAIDPGIGTTVNGRDFRVLTAAVSHQPVQVPYGTNFGHQFPIMVADISSRFGADACTLRYTTINHTSVTLFIQEEQSYDEETLHLFEDVSIFAAE